MKLKAKDLRIGNLVFDGDEIKEVDTQMLRNMLVFKHDIRPIPFTEDWIEKLGLDKAPKDFGSFEDVSARIILCRNYEKNAFQGDKRKKIEYVHDYQNIYYWTYKEELKYEL